MKILPLEFTKQGFHHKQLKRMGNVAIYSRDTHFEVIRITSHEGYTLGDTFLEPAEVYPSSSEWGRKGWTYNTLPEAEVRFQNLLTTPSKTAASHE